MFLTIVGEHELRVQGTRHADPSKIFEVFDFESYVTFHFANLGEKDKECS